MDRSLRQGTVGLAAAAPPPAEQGRMVFTERAGLPEGLGHARAAAGGRPELVTIEGADDRSTGAHPALLQAVVPWIARQLAVA